MRAVQSLLLLMAAACMGPRQESPVPGLTVLEGPVNGAFVERNGKVLAVYGDPSGKRAGADLVLFTHARRDVAWAALFLASRESEVITGVTLRVDDGSSIASAREFG